MLQKLRKFNRALHEESILSNYECQYNVYVIFRRDYMKAKAFIVMFILSPDSTSVRLEYKSYPTYKS